MHKLYKICISGQNMHLIVLYALTLQICIYTHYKSSPNEPLLCDSFASKFSDRYTESAEYALYAGFRKGKVQVGCSLPLEKFYCKKILKGKPR